MRKLFLMLVFSSLGFVASAQTQTEDEVYIDRKLSAGKLLGIIDPQTPNQLPVDY